MVLPPYRRRRARDPLAEQILGVYRGPKRAPQPPRLTPYRLRLLEAISRREIKRGHGSFTGHWRWHGVTCTKLVTPIVACGWAHEIGAHLELTEAGAAALTAAGGAT